MFMRLENIRPQSRFRQTENSTSQMSAKQHYTTQQQHPVPFMSEVDRDQNKQKTLAEKRFYQKIRRCVTMPVTIIMHLEGIQRGKTCIYTYTFR